jgi:hypothetical protein
MADLQLRIMGEDNASAAFSGVSQAARAASQVLIDFYKDSLKAFMEADKAQRQLSVVAKDLTGAFRQQADAIADNLGLQGELVMGVQTMLLRYGEAPAAVEATTKAILDYAAATGTDAQTATEALTRGVESGTGNFKGLGIAIEATGDRTKDLSLATAELAKKYGGAAAADAASLSGSIRGAQEAFGGLEEAFGGFLATIGEKTGGIAAVTAALREMGQAADFAAKFYEKGGLDELVKTGKAFLFGSNEDVASAKQSMSQLLEDTDVDLSSEAAINRQKIQRAKTGAGPKRVSGDGAGAGGGGGVMDLSRFEMDLRSTQEFDLNDVINSDSKDRERRFEEEAKAQAAGLKKHFDEMERMASAAAKTLAAQQQQFAKAGADIGAAFVNNISGALEQLASGGEQDAGKILASILAGVLSTVGSILGNLLLPGIGGALGGALGGLAGAGVKALANGPQQNITINTMDSRSTREFFEGDGGRGYYNALRTGRGQGGR